MVMASAGPSRSALVVPASVLPGNIPAVLPIRADNVLPDVDRLAAQSLWSRGSRLMCISSDYGRWMS